MNITEKDKEAYNFLKAVADNLRANNVQLDDSHDRKQHKIFSAFLWMKKKVLRKLVKSSMGLQWYTVKQNKR